MTNTGWGEAWADLEDEEVDQETDFIKVYTGEWINTDSGGDIAQKGQQDEPRNNQGRDTCFWCGPGFKTSRVEAVMGFYDVCKKCDR